MSFLFPKPAKGSALIERKERRKAMESYEDAEKRKVRLRDRTCRWPHCEFCRRYKDLRLEVAHVVQAKGMSGDRSGERSQANRMILLDALTHGQQEQHWKWIVPQHATLGTDGPCDFWATDAEGRAYLVARERAPFVYERD